MEKYVLMMVLSSGPGVSDGERAAFGTFHTEAACWQFVSLAVKDERYTWVGTCATEREYRRMWPGVPLKRSDT